MNKISCQMAMGAVVAVFLALGASASPDSGAVAGRSAMQREPKGGLLQRMAAASEPIASAAIRICGSSPQSTSRETEPYVDLIAAFQSCGDEALDVALDAFAEVDARLK